MLCHTHNAYSSITFIRECRVSTNKSKSSESKEGITKYLSPFIARLPKKSSNFFKDLAEKRQFKCTILKFYEAILFKLAEVYCFKGKIGREHKFTSKIGFVVIVHTATSCKLDEIGAGLAALWQSLKLAVYTQCIQSLYTFIYIYTFKIVGKGWATYVILLCANLLILPIFQQS